MNRSPLRTVVNRDQLRAGKVVRKVLAAGRRPVACATLPSIGERDHVVLNGESV